MTAQQNKLIIIFSGYNQRAVIAFIRTLEKHGLSYTIIARSMTDSILQSSYKNNVSFTRESDKLDLDTVRSYIEQLQKLFGFNECLIAPSTEALNRLLVREQSALAEYNAIVPLASDYLYCLVSDKYSFGELCRDKGLLVPAEYISFDNARIPFVAKPKQYISESGIIAAPFLILNDKDKSGFKDNHIISDFYFQEFIQGKSLYLLYYFHRNGNVYKFSQQNLLQQPDGKSIIAAIPSDLHKLPISTAYENLFADIGFHGLVMIEIKSNNLGDYMIEANPRFWGPSQLFIDAGINLFETLLHDYGYIAKLPAYTNIDSNAAYFWYRGLQESYMLNKKPVYHTSEMSTSFSDIDKWLEHDIYNRPDTINIFEGETQ